MLKKLVGSVASAILLLSLVLVGCEIPSDITYSEKFNTIDPPANVKATAYDGAIQLSWDASKDASTYDIYRRVWKEGDQADYGNIWLANVGPKSIPTDPKLTYEDIVGFDNQLQHGVDYEYTIVARSGQAPGDGQGQIITNASAKSPRVTANVRAVGAKLDTPVLDAVSFSNLNYDSTSRILISWKKQLGAKYELTYYYKGPNGVELFEKYASDGSQGYKDTGLTDPLGYWSVPILVQSSGQIAKIEARAIFRTDYYKPSDVATKEVSGLENRPIYSGNPNFEAKVETRKYDSDPNYVQPNIYVDLNWLALADVAEESPYVLWKAEVNNSGQIITDYTSIDAATQKDYFGTDDKPRKRVIDADIAVGKYYKYILVVKGKNNGIKSELPKVPEIDGVPANIVYVPENTNNGDAETFRNKYSTLDNDITFVANSDGKGLIIKWLAVPGSVDGTNYPADDGDLNVTYTVERAELGKDGVRDIFLNDPERPAPKKWYTIYDNRTGTSRDNIIKKLEAANWVKIPSGYGDGNVNPQNPSNIEKGESGRSLIRSGGGGDITVPDGQGYFRVLLPDNTVPRTREYYAYRITAHKNGEDAIPVIKIVNVAPFVRYSTLTIETFTEAYMHGDGTPDGIQVDSEWDGRRRLTYTQSDFWPLGGTTPTVEQTPSNANNPALVYKAATYYPGNSIVMIVNSTSFIGDVDGTTNRVEIWRRRANSDSETPFAFLARINATGRAIIDGNTVYGDANETAIPGWEYVDTNFPTPIDRSIVYQYKAVLVMGSEQLANKDTHNISDISADNSGKPNTWPRPLAEEGNFTWSTRSVLEGTDTVAPFDEIDPPGGTANIQTNSPDWNTRSLFFTFGNVKYMGNTEPIYYLVTDNNRWAPGAASGNFEEQENLGTVDLGRLRATKATILDQGTTKKWARKMKLTFTATVPNPSYQVNYDKGSPQNLVISGIVGGENNATNTLNSAFSITGALANLQVKQNGVVGSQTDPAYAMWVIMARKEGNQWRQLKPKDSSGNWLDTTGTTLYNWNSANASYPLRSSVSILQKDGWDVDLKLAPSISQR